MLIEAVIDRQFLSPDDLALAHVQDVILADPRPQIRIAGMIDVFSPAAPYRSVDGPVVVQREQVGVRSYTAALGLLAVDEFACVFDDLSPRRYRLAGVDSVAMNGRAAQNHPEARITRIDSWRCGLGFGWHNLMRSGWNHYNGIL